MDTTITNNELVIPLKLPLENALDILTRYLKGNISHIIPKVLPTIDVSNHIPLVKATNCITIEHTPGALLSLTKQPIRSPNPMNTKLTGISINIVYNRLILKVNPNATPIPKNNTD